MNEKPISPLRQRMIEDMSVRNFVEKTRNDYIRHVKTFTAFLGRSPETATPEDLRRFQLHQTQTGVRPPTINGAVVALRFFFTVTVGQANMARHLTFLREPRKIPVVLSEGRHIYQRSWLVSTSGEKFVNRRFQTFATQSAITGS